LKRGQIFVLATTNRVVSAKLSLKFCHEFAGIRSLKLHA
jgi:hypothetical protein